jgi:hypothetical protein
MTAWHAARKSPYSTKCYEAKRKGKKSARRPQMKLKKAKKLSQTSSKRSVQASPETKKGLGPAPKTIKQRKLNKIESEAESGESKALSQDDRSNKQVLPTNARPMPPLARARATRTCSENSAGMWADEAFGCRAQSTFMTIVSW